MKKKLLRTDDRIKQYIYSVPVFPWLEHNQTDYISYITYDGVVRCPEIESAMLNDVIHSMINNFSKP